MNAFTRSPTRSLFLSEVSPESFDTDFAFMSTLGYKGLMYKKGRMRPATFWREAVVPTMGEALHCDRTLVTPLRARDGTCVFVVNVHLSAGAQGKRRLGAVEDALKGIKKDVGRREGAGGKPRDSRR